MSPLLKIICKNSQTKNSKEWIIIMIKQLEGGIQIDERKKRKLIQDMKREFEVFKKTETEMV